MGSVRISCRAVAAGLVQITQAGYSICLPAATPAAPGPQPPDYNEHLLSPAQCEHIDVVLVSPRNPLNIGAAARAMANFGFSRLALVAPYEEHWREARSAVSAEDLLQHARVYPTLADAVASATLVLGTGSLTYRKPEQPVVPLPALPPLLAQEFERGGRIALVFGPEKHGLTRDDLSHCHRLIEIPTSARQPSMNLGQAVAVCLYELASHTQPPPITAPPTPAAAPTGELDRLAGLIEQTMVAAGYSPRTMQSANRHDLRVLLRRLALTPHDARRSLGLFRRIVWQLHRSGSTKSNPAQTKPPRA